MAITNQNRIIRKLIVAFGNLFNNITLVRYDQTGKEQERFLVPLEYAPKELYVQRLESDPDLTKKTQITLPRMSYEMLGMKYDASRKQLTNVKNFAKSGPVGSYYNPVPYDFDFTLSIYTRNHEDVHSIVECLLPFFTPDFTLSVNLLPELNVTKEIPIILKSTDREVRYDGNRDSDTRMIIWTLDFTLKGYIYGGNTDVSNNLILQAITNLYFYDNNALIETITTTPTQNINIFTEGFGNSFLTENGQSNIQIPVDVSEHQNMANVGDSYTVTTDIQHFL